MTIYLNLEIHDIYFDGGVKMMDYYMYPYGLGIFGMGLGMIIFWGLLIWIIYLIIKSASQNNSNSLKSDGESALEVAKKRYAKGEITKKEFDEMKKEFKK